MIRCANCGRTGTPTGTPMFLVEMAAAPGCDNCPRGCGPMQVWICESCFVRFMGHCPLEQEDERCLDC
jgi:hypothetical protein